MRARRGPEQGRSGAGADALGRLRVSRGLARSLWSRGFGGVCVPLGAGFALFQESFSCLSQWEFQLPIAVISTWLFSFGARKRSMIFRASSRAVTFRPALARQCLLLIKESAGSQMSV